MKTLLHVTALTLTLTLASCGKNNGSESSKSLNAGATSPATNIKVSDNGSQLVVTTEPAVVSTQPAVEEATQTISIPETTAPVLVQIISPTEITETIVNVDPSQPDKLPETIVEVIVDVAKPVLVDDVPAEIVEAPVESPAPAPAPVYETIVQKDPIIEAPVAAPAPVIADEDDSDDEIIIDGSPAAPSVDVINTGTVKEIEDVIKNTKPDDKQLSKIQLKLKNLKRVVFNRIKIIEKYLELHAKKKNMNKKKVAQWQAELKLLKALVERIEKWEVRFNK